MFRLEQGVRIDTNEKRATSRCISIILEAIDNGFCGQEPPNEVLTEGFQSKLSGDALCLVEDTPKHSRARMGARLVNPVKLDIERVIDWLSECEGRHHRICQPTWNEKLMQIFLVDVKARRIVSYPSAKCDYIALSYVWGGVDQSIPVAGKSGGSLSMALPATIEDAMSLANALGKQYLWVDSICINQMDQAERLKQIGLMSGIYQGAYMTIIAMSGTSANAGLARVGHTPIVQHQAQFRTKSGTVVGIGPTLGYLISQMPWAKRAWTFQEAILSQRCLYLTEFQAYFECNAMQCCESLDILQCCESFEDSRLSVSQDPYEYTNYKINHVFKPAGPGELRNPFVPGLITGDTESLRRYGTLVEKYKTRVLTYESDAINAFASILQAMEGSFFPSGFVLGLPVSALHCALLWEKINAHSGKQIPDFPSWTWASWSGPVRMAHIDHIYQGANDFAEGHRGHLGQELTIWRKGPNGITKIFAESQYDRSYSGSAIRKESLEWRDLPLENTKCLHSLHNMSFEEAEHVLCVECYQLKFVFNPRHPKHSKSGHGHTFATATYGADIEFIVPDGSEILSSLHSTKERRYLVIAVTAKFGPLGRQYHLLGIEPVGQFWKRVGTLRISVHLDKLDALRALRPCRTRVLLI